jgi:hypothetical protein
MAEVRRQLGADRLFVAILERDALAVWAPGFADRRSAGGQIATWFARGASPLSDELFVSAADGIRLATTDERHDNGLAA